jgi:restriction system protein
MRSWLVRSGRDGSNDNFCLSENYVLIGWSSLGDLTGLNDRESIQKELERAYPQDGVNTIRAYTAQVYAFVSSIQTGDLVVLPLKSTKQIAIGKVVGDYTYDASGEPGRRHLRKVEWLATDVARTAIHQDLLATLGAFMTVCEVSRNGALQRLEVIAAKRQDPGYTGLTKMPASGGTTDSTLEISEVDLNENAADRILSRISEIFAGHGLAKLVAAILETEGFVCEVSPEGPDGGIDIFAGRGPLGLDAPRLLVQVKSGSSAIDAPTVRQLHGVISTHGGDQGLLVAWGGINKIAQKELTTQKFNLRVWDANDVLDRVTKNYSMLPEEIRVKLPLRQIWILE